MSRIENAVEQAQIENSLLDAPIVGDWKHDPLPDAEPWSNEERFADSEIGSHSEQMPQEEVEQLAQKVAGAGERFERPEDVRARQEAERQEQQPEQQQQSPQSVYENIQKLDATIQEHGLNDPESARTFATEFCDAFGTSAFNSGVNAEALGSVMAKTAFSAAGMYDALQRGEQLGPVPAEAGRAFTSDFLRSFGVDPRGVQVDSQLFAETALQGTLNLIDTYQRFGGKVTNLDQLNDPAMAEQFLAGINKAFGIEGPVDRSAALRVADACGKYVLSFLGKLQQIKPQAAPQRAGRRGSSGQRQSTRRWKSNNDIFEGAEEMLTNEKTGRQNGQEFTPKQRRGAARFQTNADIFDAETMEAFSGRL